MAKRKIKRLYLLDDDKHTMVEVVGALILSCGHNMFQSEQCAMIAHHQGKCLVKETTNSRVIKNIHEALSKNGFNVILE